MAIKFALNDSQELLAQYRELENRREDRIYRAQVDFVDDLVRLVRDAAAQGIIEPGEKYPWEEK